MPTMRIGRIPERTLKPNSNMKSFLYTIIFQSMLLPLVVADTLSDYYKILDGSRDQGPEAALMALRSSSSIKDWSFGGGLGPIDRQHMRFLAVVRLYSEIQKINGSHGSDDWTKEVIATAKADPNDNRKIGSFLASSDPSIRWIALKKCQELAPRDLALHTQMLTSIASLDSFIYVTRVSVEKDSGPPLPPGQVTHQFAAPLRQMASQLLGGSLDGGSQAVASAGIKALFEISKSDTSKKEMIEEAIRALEPTAPEIQSAQKLLQK